MTIATLTTRTAQTSDATPAKIQAAFADLVGDGSKLAVAHAVLNTLGALIDPASKQDIASLVTALGSPAQTGDISALLTKLGTTLAVSAANLPLPTGAATDANLVAILNAIKAQIDIAPLFVTDGTHYYVRREQVNEGTQAITVVFENIDGTAATPASVSALSPIVASGSSGGAASTRYVEQTLFDVTTGATGYAAGDVIARAVFYDTSTSSVVASAWLNLTQGTTLSGAPTAANLREQTQNIAVTSSALPAGAATEATLSLIRALLAGTLAVALPTGKATPANSLSVKAFDNLATGTIAAATANAAYTVALGNGEGVVGFSVSGLTASGATLTAEATNNSGNWVAINTILPGSGALSQTITADGNYRVNAAGHDNVRLRVSAGGTGTITVGSDASSAQGLVALSAVASTRGVAGLGALTAVPAGSTNGTALGTMPAGAQGARLYLPTGASITFAVASAAPSSAPTTFTVSASTTGPNWDENLSGGQMIYVTAVTGSPLFRWY